MNQAPSISSFHYDISSNGSIESSVNMYRGAVCFDYTLVDLAKHGDVGITIAASYNSDIDKYISLSNYFSSTGIIGEGWSLTYLKIECDEQDICKAPKDRNYRLTTGEASGGGEILHLIDEEDDRLIYESDSYNQNAIVFDTKKNQWTLTDTSGIVSIYGGVSNEASYYEYAVVSDGVFTEFPCTDASDLKQCIRAWVLAEVRSPYGNSVRYEYSFEMKKLYESTPEYTKAVYLRRMYDSFGNAADLVYGDKLYSNNISKPVEYIDPYCEDVESPYNFHQSRYETKFLDHIEVSNTSGKLYTVQLRYILKSFSSDPDKSGITSKRLLKSIQMINSSGKTMPSMEFEYCGENELNSGALKSVNYPEGGTVNYTYSQNHSIFANDRTENINDFSGNLKSCFGPDFALLINANQNQAEICVYSWIGRWQKYQPSADLKCIDPETIKVSTQSKFAVVSGKSFDGRRCYYIVFTKYRKIRGGWYENELSSIDTEDIEVITGPNWFIVQNVTNNEIEYYYLDELEEKWEKGEFPDSSADYDYYCRFAVCDNRLVRFAYNTKDGEYENKLKVYEIDCYHKWNTIITHDVHDTLIQKVDSDYMYITTDAHFIAGVFVSDRTNNTIRYKHIVWRLDSENKLVEEINEVLGHNFGDFQYIIPKISGNTIMTAGRLYRYIGENTGEKWAVCEDLSARYSGKYQFAVMYDIAAASYLNEQSDLEIKSAVFNKETNEWTTRTVRAEKRCTVPSVGVSISYDIAILGDKVYDTRDMTFDHVIETLDSSYGTVDVYNNNICIVSNVYCKKDDKNVPCGSYIRVYADGKLAASYLDDKILSGNCSGSYCCFSLEDSDNDIELLYAGNCDPKSEIFFYQAVCAKISDGIDTVKKNYSYTSYKASSDETSQYAQYAEVTVSYGRNSKNIYNYYDSVAETSKYENLVALSVNDGTLVSVKSYTDNRLQNSFTSEYKMTDVVNNKKIYGNTLLEGKFTEISDIDKNGAGVQKVTLFKVDPFSGQRIEAVTYNYNAEGECEKNTIQTFLAYTQDEYRDMMLKLHRLCDISKEVSMVNDKVVAEKEYSYDSFDDIYTEKSVVNNTHSQSQQEVLYTVSKRDKFGNITAKKGEFSEYFVFDKDGFNRIASFTNSEFGECFAYTFEDYEVSPETSSNNASVVENTYCIGTKCAYIKADGSYTIRHKFKAYRTEYALSFYAQCSSVSKVIVRCGDRTQEIPINSGGFHYEFSDLRSLEIEKGKDYILEIEFTSQKNMYIDAVMFFPLYNPPQVNVYCQGGSLIAGSLSGYGELSEPIYDKLSRSICVVEKRRIFECLIPSFGRDRDSVVNSSLYIKNAGEGIFRKRVELRNHPNQQIQFEESLFANFRAEGNIDVTFVDGSVLQLTQEVLEINLTSKERPIIIDLDKYKDKFITGVFSDILLLCIDGEIVYCDKLAPKLKGPFTINGDAIIYDIAIGLSPVVKMTYSDGSGKVRQVQKLCDDKTIINAFGYDELGRQIIDTVPAYNNDLPFMYIEDYIRSVDWKTGKIRGRVNDFAPQCEEYPYIPSIYEERYNGRILETGMSSKECAVSENIPREQRHTTRYSYSTDIPDCPQLEKIKAAQSSGEKHYTVSKVLDPDNNEMISVYDINKEKIADYIKLADKEICTVYSMKKDSEYSYKTLTLPNGNQKWSKFDLRGNLVESNDVNSGSSKFFYDIHNKLRFEKDSALEEKTFRYKIYDSIDRIIEEGVFKTDLSDDELQKKTEEALYPQDKKCICRKYYYDGDHSKDSMGMLTKTELFNEAENSNDIITTITYSMDKENNIFTKSISIDDNTITTVTKYDNFGNVIEKTGSDSEKLEYSYDHILRNTCISSKGETITKTSYTANGLPQNVTSCGSTISYKYDCRNKITNIDSDLFSEKITYLDGEKYYGGKIKKLESEIKSDSKTNPPNKLSYELEYDGCGQLSSAICSEYEEASMKNITYDKNGNIISYNDTEKFELESGTDKVKTTGHNTYEYNANGAVSKISGKKNISIDYYPYSRLPKKFTTDDCDINIVYDDNGKRLQKTVNKKDGSKLSKIYLYEGTRLTEEIADGKNKKYIYGTSGINAVLQDGKKISVITDRLGYTRVVAESKKIIQAYHYKPFGEVLKIIEESQLVNMLFGGFELDSETDLYYAKARLYDPKLLRFLSTDPQGEFSSPYTFCGNDPFSIIDENGEASWIGALIGAVVGIVLTIGLTLITAGVGVAVLPVAASGVVASEATAVAAEATLTAGQIAAHIFYNMAAASLVAAASGFASEGVRCLVDGESFAAESAYGILLSSAVTGLVFGGFAKGLDFLIEKASKAVICVTRGIALTLVNAGAQASVSPVADIINGESPSGLNAAISAGFGAVSGFVTGIACGFSTLLGESDAESTTNVRARMNNYFSNKINEGEDSIKRDAIETFIWAACDPAVYYSALTSSDSSSAVDVYDNYSLGSRQLYRSEKGKSTVDISNKNLVLAYSCFNSRNSGNLKAPRFFSSRGFGQKMV